MTELIRNRLTPWFVGIAMVAITDLIAAFAFVTQICPCGAAPDVAVILFVLVFLALPVVYLALMYLALKSQR
jgi:hypothetical protein